MIETNPVSSSAQGTKSQAGASGLSRAEAARRLVQYGFNELPEKKVNPILKFLSYFWGPIPWMIEAAVLLSALVRHWEDFAIILVLLVGNAVVGFWEEYQAGNAIAALQARLALEARVKRDGEWTTVPARELVPGDLIRLRLGDIIPADASLLEGDPIDVDQSALTGESLPVSHKTGDTVYSGSIVKQGEIDALVGATGKSTYFGKTARLVEEAHTVSHFQKAVLKIGDYLIVIAVVLVALILTVALFRGDNSMTTLQFALVLTVAAIPVAMPTVLSVTMAVGARVLAARQAIVSRLVAIEELAGMDVLCSDKTGTLTQNKLTLGEPFCVERGDAERSDPCRARWPRAPKTEDPIDLAVLGGLKDSDALQGCQVIHFQPFDPVHKRTEATVQGPDGTQFKVTKGAPQVIMALAANAAQVQAEVDEAVNEFAARGFRSLGVARTDDQDQWQFLGVLPLYDPPREDSKATIDTARKMGVSVKMVTGDQIAIAKEIGPASGAGHQHSGCRHVRRYAPLQRGPACRRNCPADGFAQVFPEHKYHIVEVLQGQRAHRRHDGRRRERCAGTQESGRRHRRVGRHGCRPRGGRHRVDSTRASRSSSTPSRRAARSSSG